MLSSRDENSPNETLLRPVWSMRMMSFVAWWCFHWLKFRCSFIEILRGSGEWRVESGEWRVEMQTPVTHEFAGIWLVGSRCIFQPFFKLKQAKNRKALNAFHQGRDERLL